MTVKLYLVDENMTYKDFMDFIKEIYTTNASNPDSKLDIEIQGKIVINAKIDGKSGWYVK